MSTEIARIYCEDTGEMLKRLYLDIDDLIVIDGIARTTFFRLSHSLKRNFTYPKEKDAWIYYMRIWKKYTQDCVL